MLVCPNTFPIGEEKTRVADCSHFVLNLEKNTYWQNPEAREMNCLMVCCVGCLPGCLWRNRGPQQERQQWHQNTVPYRLAVSSGVIPFGYYKPWQIWISLLPKALYYRKILSSLSYLSPLEDFCADKLQHRPPTYCRSGTCTWKMGCVVDHRAAAEFLLLNFCVCACVLQLFFRHCAWWRKIYCPRLCRVREAERQTVGFRSEQWTGMIFPLQWDYRSHTVDLRFWGVPDSHSQS